MRHDQANILFSRDLEFLISHVPGLDPGEQCRPLLIDSAETDGDDATVYLMSVAFWLEQLEEYRYALLQRLRKPAATTILVGKVGERLPAELSGDGLLTAWLEEPVGEPALRVAIASAHRAIELRLSLEESKRAEWQRAQDMEQLHHAGMALSSERDLRVLQHLILETSRNVTHADAGTLYAVQTTEGGEAFLCFCVAQNDSLNSDYETEVLPIDRHSVAGFVASTGKALVLEDAYRLSADVEYEFNPAFDRAFGYVTRSMMVMPMINYEGAVVGVIQLINRKRNRGAVLRDARTVDEEVQPFTRRDEWILSYLAGQAAVALENRMLLETNRLYKELRGAYSRLEDYLREVSKVITAASDVEAGTFQAETLAEVAQRDDDLGQLGRVFQRMAREVIAREERLKQQVMALHIEIDQTKQARQVAEITESDFFLDLQQKARALREKR